MFSTDDIFLHILILPLVECSDAESMGIEGQFQLKAEKNCIFQKLNIFTVLCKFILFLRGGYGDEFETGSHNVVWYSLCSPDWSSTHGSHLASAS